MDERSDVVIVGGGPAGAQCALWLTKLGVDCLLLEDGVPGGLQARSPFTNSWLAVVQATTAAKNVASNIADNLRAQGCRHAPIRCLAIERTDEGFDAVHAAGRIAARYVVVASGTREATGGLESNPRVVFGLVGADSLRDLTGHRVALLGGGDAACEAYHLLADRNPSDIRVFARSVRARADHWSGIPESHKSVGRYDIADNRVLPDGGAAPYDFDVAVACYGWTPQTPQLPDGVDRSSDGYLIVSSQMETSVPGLFAIGDVNARPYPCVTTALSDGVFAAKGIEHRMLARR